MMNDDYEHAGAKMNYYFVRYNTSNDPLVSFFTIGGFLDEVASVKLNLHGECF